MQMLPDRVGDLRGQPLLDLEAPSEAVQHARELADADDAVLRQVGDRRLADDRRHVVLAMRLERDVLEEHDLVIAAHLFEGAAEVSGGVLFIATGIFTPGAGHAARRIQQSLTIWIVAGPADKSPDSFLDVLRHFGSFAVFDEVAVFGFAVLKGRIHALSSRLMSSATAAACSRMSGTAMISQ